MVVVGTVITIIAWVTSMSVERGREREMHAKWWMSNPRRLLRHARCLFSYFLIYLTMWVKPLFSWFGEILIYLHILWKFCFCNIILTCYGLQKWQNRFGVDCKSSHSSNSGGFSPIKYNNKCKYIKYCLKREIFSWFLKLLVELLFRIWAEFQKVGVALENAKSNFGWSMRDDTNSGN